MVKKLLVPGLVVTLLAGCGQAANDVRLSLARNELRQNCFGNDTYDCRSQTVDFNQKVLELTDFKNDNAKEGITKLFGDDGWSLYQDVADEFVEEGIDMLEDMRPNIFARIFFGDSQPVSPKGRVMDFNPEDMAQAERELQMRFSVRAKKEGLKPDEKALREYAQAQAAENGDVVNNQEGAGEPQLNARIDTRADGGSEPQLNAAIDTSAAGSEDHKPMASGSADLSTAINAYVAAMDTDGGVEYLEGRQIVQVDLNGDGELDAAVLFTIEGAGGSQAAYQTLAAFYQASNGWQAQGGDVVVTGSVREVREVGGRTIFVDAVIQGDDDPRCCPTAPFPQRYHWSGSKFVQLPSANG